MRQFLLSLAAIILIFLASASARGQAVVYYSPYVPMYGYAFYPPGYYYSLYPYYLTPYYAPGVWFFWYAAPRFGYWGGWHRVHHGRWH